MKIIQLLLLTLALTGTAVRGVAQPVITTQPRSQTNVAGTTATFTVAATGTPPLSYQWRSYANPSSFTNIPFGTEATLVLTNVEPTPRRFGVVVTDGGGLSVTSSPLVVLTVLTPPAITQQPTNSLVFLSGSASLYVTATGTGLLRYQWMFSNPTNPVPGATNASLLFPNLRTNQAGNYYVVVTNALGAVTSSVARVGFFWAPSTGTDIPALARLDTNMQSLLFRYGIPGGALAVVKDGRLVFARGYGYADTNTGEVVQPDSLFRVASLSKTITAAATMKLVEDGKLSLTNSAFDILQYPAPTYAGATNDPRLGSITIQNLLNHTAGWARYEINNPNGSPTFDPVFWTDRAAADMGTQAPASAATIVQWMMGKPLDFTPGTRYVYSNLGYVVLGRVIEKITGQSYENYVKSLFGPLGITRTRIAGDTSAQRSPGEVVYYDYPTALSHPYAFGSDGLEPRPSDAPLPYAYSMSAWDAAASWMTSAIDCLRFATAVDGRSEPPDILSAATLQAMSTPSSVSIGANNPYGLGRTIDLVTGDWRHSGWSYGNRALVMVRQSGIAFVYAFNFAAYLDDTSFQFPLDTVTSTTDGIRAWPTNNFFPTTLSYDAWRDRHFTAAELADPAISGDQANPDGDDSVNLLEYATGSDPKLSDSDHPPTGSFVTVDGQRYFALTFRRLILGYELDYVVEASDDLLTWSPLTEPVGSPQLNPDGTQTVTIRDSAPANTASHRYLRLRVSRQ